ncbi:O-antigen ligase family protein [uncultured Metabacillus sp.]|uniref:O-antigen ligase family protein n=1 Tax=uncultured Metabacillus sp. TaxID=2860135 RepID=UPI00260A401C|nr:O-antigen ligase family protein [uncultured Metabacillus sp.]
MNLVISKNKSVKWFYLLSICIVMVSLSDMNLTVNAIFNKLEILIYVVSMLIFVISIDLNLIKRNIIYLTIGIFSLFSCLWSANPNLTLKNSFLLLGLIIFALNAVRYLEREDIIKVILVFFTLILILNIFSILFMKDISIQFDSRSGLTYRGLFYYRTGFAGYMGIILIYSLVSAYIFRKNKYIILCLFNIIISIILIALGKAVTTMVVSVVCIVFFYLYKNTNRKLLLTILIITPFIFSFILIYYGTTGFVEIFLLLGRDPTITGRTIIWSSIVEMLSSNRFNSIFGFGTNTFWKIDSLRGYIDRNMGGFKTPHAHNGYLELILNWGYIGITLYGIQVIRIINNGIRKSIKLNMKIYSALPIVFYFYIWCFNITENNLFNTTSIVGFLQIILFSLLFNKTKKIIK